MIPPALIHQIQLEPGHRIIITLPSVHLIDGPVRSAVIGRAVMPQAISHGLDQDWTRLAHGYVSRGLGRIVDREQVVSVHADGHDSVARAAAGHSVASVLILDVGRYGVAIVAAEEDHGHVEYGRKVHGGVRVALARAAVAEVGDRAQAVLHALVGVGGAHGLWHLRGDGARNGHKVQVLRTVVDGHLAALARAQRVAENLMRRLLYAVAAPQNHASFSVLSFI